MKKGFTLIELLAVIIILAVIALIATPIVLDVVESAKRSAFESTAYGMVDAMKLNSAEDMIDGNSMAKEYTFPSTELDVQGEQLTGSGKVDSQGRLAIAVNNGKWCATKCYSEGTITIKEYVEGECTLPVEEEVTYNVSDYVKIKVGPNAEDVYNFYILSVDGENVTAIMDRNIGNDIAWGNRGDTTSTIAETQITPLKTTWSNVSEVRLPYLEEILEHTEWYKNLEDKTNLNSQCLEKLDTVWNDTYYEKYEYCLENDDTNECFRNAAIYAGNEDILVPTWLDINLHTSGDSAEDNNGNYKQSYWIQDIVSAQPDNAWSVDIYGFVNFYYVGYSGGVGVRPVITINESNIIAELDAPEYVDSGFTRE